VAIFNRRRFSGVVAGLGLASVLAMDPALAEQPAADPASDRAGPVLNLREQIEAAYQARDLAGLERARASLLHLAAEAPGTGEQARVRYLAAYARFRQGLAAEGNAKAARTYLDHCIQELQSVVRSDPGNAEALALLGSCYGISTRYHPLTLASRGLKARSHMAAARALAPDNPWVMLQDGLADFATPRLFGGDPALGITKLERAASLFTGSQEDGARAAGARILAWAAAETWLQLGRMYRETGRDEDAREAFTQAALLVPGGPGPNRRLAAL
jgi:tetratricopeptide (TPR) repeat protein